MSKFYKKSNSIFRRGQKTDFFTFWQFSKSIIKAFECCSSVILRPIDLKLGFSKFSTTLYPKNIFSSRNLIEKIFEKFQKIRKFTFFAITFERSKIVQTGPAFRHQDLKLHMNTYKNHQKVASLKSPFFRFLAFFCVFFTFFHNWFSCTGQ